MKGYLKQKTIIIKSLIILDFYLSHESLKKYFYRFYKMTIPIFVLSIFELNDRVCVGTKTRQIRSSKPIGIGFL